MFQAALGLGLAALFAAGPLPTLTLEECLAQARPGLAEARSGAELAEIDAGLLGARGLLRENAELSALVGRRSVASETNADFGLEVDLPLANRASRTAHEELGRRLEADRDLLVAAARLEDRRLLVFAYLELWGAQQRRELLESSALALESFSRLTADRIDAGAVAAYEGHWVATEARLARGELALAGAAEREAFLALRRLSLLPAETLPRLVRPRFTLEEVDASEPTSTLPFAALRAEERVALSRSQWSIERELSRSGVVGSLAREGEESIVSVGWRWRLPMAGERGALRARGDAERLRSELATERRVAELAARIDESRALLAALGEPQDEEEASDAMWRAVELRVREGKEMPAEALAFRRAANAARLAALELEERRLAAQAELFFLTQEISQ